MTRRAKLETLEILNAKYAEDFCGLNAQEKHIEALAKRLDDLRREYALTLQRRKSRLSTINEIMQIEPEDGPNGPILYSQSA